MSGWDGILDADQSILWQGNPDAKVIPKPRHWVTFLFGLAFSAFSFVWMIGASSAGGSFWMFGFVHFFVGLTITYGPLFWSAWRRRFTHYTLTSKRGLKSYPIEPGTMLEFVPGDPASIHFAAEERRADRQVYMVPIGFEHIKAGQEVYRLFRQVQEAA